MRDNRADRHIERQTITRRTAIAGAAAMPLLPVAAIAGGSGEIRQLATGGKRALAHDLATGGNVQHAEDLPETESAGGNATLTSHLATADDPIIPVFREWQAARAEEEREFDHIAAIEQANGGPGVYCEEAEAYRDAAIPPLIERANVPVADIRRQGAP